MPVSGTGNLALASLRQAVRKGQLPLQRAVRNGLQWELQAVQTSLLLQAQGARFFSTVSDPPAISFGGTRFLRAVSDNCRAFLSQYSAGIFEIRLLPDPGKSNIYQTLVRNKFGTGDQRKFCGAQPGMNKVAKQITEESHGEDEE